MTALTTRRTVWNSAKLLIAFHKDKQRKTRETPFFWSPKEAFARLLANTGDQEAFVQVQGEDRADDVQIKLHPDRIIVRRSKTEGWSGLVIYDDHIRIGLPDMTIKVAPDGTVTVDRDAGTTYLDGDGSIIKVSPDAEILVSSDGAQISRKTDYQLDAITADGILSRAR